MLVESLLAMTLLTADKQHGSLDIDIQQEDKDNVNKDLNQYDTTLFDKDSKSINDAIKKKEQKKNQDIKNNMFHNQTGPSTRLDETKNVLFGPSSQKDRGSNSDKKPYIQNEQERNILPYILISVGAALTLGFILFSIQRRRASRR
ncbi:type VII secretion protein EssA [Mammaliicoccus sp. Dog046]|uniref:type VII secretion protein EssA n=1 Tax=Mammaliicoccus sp. Dog046 TaxID=3034233 RepID=UPI002B25D492|nr:type VII secretion protein EssA [Mammaliicoccus sp. Dog046]WQK85581.1 type VII secretion protein EssA [Mammaliicoccus sp. Dog046]